MREKGHNSSISYCFVGPKEHAPNTGRLTRRMHAWDSAYSCTLVQDLFQPHSKNTQLNHKGKKCRQRNQCQASLSSPSSGGMHGSALSSPAANTAITCVTLLPRDPSRDSVPKVFTGVCSYGHPLLACTTYYSTSPEANVLGTITSSVQTA